MNLKQLQEEQERLMHDFTSGMAEWLEAFNNYADRLIENNKKTEQTLREVRDAYAGGEDE